MLYPGLKHLDLSEVEVTCQTGGPGGSLHVNDEEEEEESWEPYTSERLADLPRGYRVLSDIVPTFQIDFNNPQVIVH